MLRESLRVKEFADLAGVSVRTLQYYDKEGLLKPSGGYTDEQHRLYHREDLLRLQQILTLKFMGFSLKDITALLGSPAYDIRQSLQTQKEAIDERITRLQRVSTALAEMLTALDTVEPADLDWPIVSEIIQGVLAAEKWRWLPRYYTPEQEQTLFERYKALSTHEILEGRRRWARLLASVEALCQRGVPADDDAMQKLAVQATVLIEEFTGGDLAMRQNLARMYENIPAERHPYGLELQQYLHQALKIYHERKIDQ